MEVRSHIFEGLLSHYIFLQDRLGFDEADDWEWCLLYANMQTHWVQHMQISSTNTQLYTISTAPEYQFQISIHAFKKYFLRIVFRHEGDESGESGPLGICKPKASDALLESQMFMCYACFNLGLD